MKRVLTITLTVGAVVAAAQPRLPQGYRPEARSAEILAKTESIRLAPELRDLSEGERAAIKELLLAGEIMQTLYEDSRHPQATTAYRDLVALDRKLGGPVATQNLLKLYRLTQGPSATTLDNRREPFLPVPPQTPARNV